MHWRTGQFRERHAFTPDWMSVSFAPAYARHVSNHDIQLQALLPRDQKPQQGKGGR